MKSRIFWKQFKSKWYWRFKSFKSLVKTKIWSFLKRSREYGLPIPKGVLLVGPQGTGKSLTAKSISKTWSMPLLRLDVGRLFSSLVGLVKLEQERQLQEQKQCLLHTLDWWNRQRFRRRRKKRWRNKSKSTSESINLDVRERVSRFCYCHSKCYR